MIRVPGTRAVTRGLWSMDRAPTPWAVVQELWGMDCATPQ